MFERYITEVLTTYFGQYIENVDTDQIRLSAWNGRFILQDVQLRADCLQRLASNTKKDDSFPVEVVYGHIGRLELRIPWKLLRQQLLVSSSKNETTTASSSGTDANISLLLSHVDVLIAPIQRPTEVPSSYPQPMEEEDDVTHQQRIQAAMDAELLRRVALSSQETTSSSLDEKSQPPTSPTKKSSNWKQRLQQRLQSIFANNLSVTVHHIHVRYEDPGNCLGFLPRRMTPTTQYRPPWAMGLTLREFSILPSSLGPRQTAVTHDLAAYWDSDVVVQLHRTSEEERRKMMDNEDPPPVPRYALAFQELNQALLRGPVDAPHFYVLNPFSPSIHWGLGSTEDATEIRPFHTMDILFPPCRWNVSKNLLEDLGYLRNSITVWLRRDVLLPEKHADWTVLRPTSTRFLPKEWWHYAYKSVLMILHRDYHGREHPNDGWLGLVRALGRRRRYAQLYRDFLLQNATEHRHRVHEELVELERTLPMSEIVAFRIYLYYNFSPNTAMGQWIASVRAKANPDADELAIRSVYDANAPERVLTVEHRLQMFVEMILALDREQQNLQLQEAQDHVGRIADSASVKALSWKITLQCVELSLQVHDSPEMDGRDRRIRKNDSIPVVLLSCAFDQQQELFECGSWSTTFRVGSLFVKDCTVRDARSPFSNLIGLQQNAAVLPVDTFDIDGTTHHQIIWIQVKRSKWKARDDLIATRTETNVRVLPLEVVYSTAPIESLNHILLNANVDFSDDYHRIRNRFSVWKDRQKIRLLNALAHKQKQIFINVMIGAPVFLFPEDPHGNSSLVVIDLGMLRFSNTESKDQSEYDDEWLLEMTDIQVKSMRVHQYCSTPDTNREPGEQLLPHYIIEPFSLKFDIYSTVQTNEADTPDGQTKVLVLANLPRLAFNLKSSSVCLLFRLHRQWMRLKKDRRLFVPAKTRMELSTKKEESPKNSRLLEFRFVAPIFSVKFERDNLSAVTVKLSKESIPLFDLALKGIEGSVLRFSSTQLVSTTFSAKVCSLVAVDLFQSAGDPYCLLMSSVSPALLSGISRANILSDPFLGGTNLVSFEYSSKTDLLADVEIQQESVEYYENVDLLRIKFHELFVEWNPETIAMMSAALFSPSRASDEANADLPDRSPIYNDKARIFETDIPKDEEFFDAEEDAFYDAESVASFDQGSRLLSEISESERSSFSDFVPSSFVGPLSTWVGLGGPVTVLQPVAPGSPWSGRILQPALPAAIVDVRQKKPFAVIFVLSKLSVNFNKESHHRRLLTAEMDRTEVRYNAMGVGVSKILFTIGNLTFSDCESQHNNTLYREILGLQTEGSNKNGEHSSLLEMEMITKPRSRKYVSLDDIENDPSSAARTPVFVDTTKGSIQGFDNHLEARLSPMRFVYLQQLWFEIVDYFFTAIVGYEVWGGKTPVPGDTSMLNGTSIGANEVPFTLFDVLLHSPIILFPVSPCSTHFVRLAASSVSLKNRYSFDVMRPASLFFHGDGVNLQWYNNCCVEIKGMALTSWAGSVLDRVDERPTARLSMSWPVGPSAPVNVPKWKVDCTVDTMHIVLDREDYALLQHVIQHNIGGDSLHLDEWNQLQRLCPAAKARFYDSLLVRFPYDKKDTTPTTFDMIVTTPKILFVFNKGQGHDVAVIRCSDVRWKYEKLLDRVTKQNVTCTIDILESLRGRPVLSSISEESATMDDVVFPTLSYWSITLPSLNNDKSLVITDACIDSIYPFWMIFGSFFQNLPLPVYLSPNEAIQVGDRWYRIGEHSPRSSRNEALLRLRWIQDLGPSVNDATELQNILSPSFTFHFSLIRPAIRICSGDSAVVLSIESFLFSHKSSRGQISRTFNFQGVELQTRQLGKMRRSSEFSLIRPWNVVISMSGCQSSEHCTCLSHSCNASVGLLQARAAYSDMTAALDACMPLIRDIRSFRKQSYQDNRNTSFEPKQRLQDQSTACRHEKRRRLLLDWQGLRLIVADDSGRHFVGNQDLVVLFVRDICFRRDDGKEADLFDPSIIGSRTGTLQSSMHLQVKEFEVIDCLQSEQSPFRKVLLVTVNAQSDLETDIMTSDVALLEKCKNDSSAVEVWSKVNEDKAYGITFGTVEVQYNPSFVVASQRLLGRLMKEVKTRHGDLLEHSSRSLAKGNSSSSNCSTSPTQQMFLSRTNIRVHHMLISLNKEHKKRRLLKMSIARVMIDFERSATFSSVKGHVGEFSALDPMGKEEEIAQIVVQSTSTDRNFIEFDYKLFAGRLFEVSSSSDTLPFWIQSRLKDDDMIDDYLDVSVSTLDFVYLKGRTAELLDYLSSGMPGRGMGATSRAAKGFLNERIQKRSFAHIQLGAPRVIIPQSLFVASYIILRLGDLSLKSWVATNVDSVVTRKVEVLLSGFASDLRRTADTGPVESNLMSKIDIEVDAELSAVATTVRCHLSDVIIRLVYQEYVSLRCIILENIGRKVDRDRWDNLEKAWEKEFKQADSIQQDTLTYSLDVAYSSSARVVRYGQSKSTRSVGSRGKLSLNCGSLAVVLSKDCSISNSEVFYDMIGIRGQGFDFEVGRREDGEEWLNLSLRNIFVADLGKDGRLQCLNRRRNENHRRTDSLSVLVEGYRPQQASISKDSKVDSHVVVKVDRDSLATGDVNIVVIISFLSVTFFVEPLQDLMSFVTCKWTTEVPSVATQSDALSVGDTLNKEISTEKLDISSISINYKIKLRFVSHYARFVFAADELDPHSRSLMLQGLSIANASFRPLEADSGAGKGTVFNFSADFQDVSSRIISDIAQIVGIQPHHVGLLAGLLPSEFLEQINPYCFVEGAVEDFGVPLLLPLTFGIEYEQKNALYEPTSRSIAISIDPLSVFLSNEDVKLLRAVVYSWTSRKKSSEKLNRKPISSYDVSFHSERLGLGLRKDNGRVVVDNVVDPRNQDLIQTGDFLFAINGMELLDLATLTLSEIVDRLSSEARPLTLTFVREIPLAITSNVAEFQLVYNEAHLDFVDNINISMSSAVLTFVEKELPLFRGSLSTAKFSCNIIRSTVTALRTELSSGISIDYYNLRIWNWEPFVDPGVVFLSSTYQDAHLGPNELAIEIGDRDVGLSVNVTDALMKSICKVLDWGNDALVDSIDEMDGFFVDDISGSVDESDTKAHRDAVSQKAANAAFRFASRQEVGTAKPFVFRNRSGVSVALAMQKGFPKLRPSNEALLSMGDFSGLEHYEPSEIMVLSNGEDLKFRIDVGSNDSNIDRRIALFPAFTVALQKTSGIAVQPFENLQTSRQGELLLPLSFGVDIGCETNMIPPSRSWMSWLVEQSDETSIVTIGSSIRLVSMLSQAIEVGIAIKEKYIGAIMDDASIMSLGTLREATPFSLPLWIAMQLQSWVCYVRLGSGHHFAPIFIVSPDGCVTTETVHDGLIECRPLRGSAMSSWLTLFTHEEGGVLLVHIDGSVSILNLLPLSIDWELGHDNISSVDGSTLRAQSLRSGEEVEVLIKNVSTAKIRLRPIQGDFTWSPWESVSLPEKRKSIRHHELSTNEVCFPAQEERYVTVHVNDLFGIPLPLGVRIASKQGGVDVTLYADLWCVNCTTIDILFGSQLINVLRDENLEMSKPFKELTVAEATLKEISSLFESDDLTRSVENGSREFVNDFIRIPGQVSPHVVEECFEYVEVERNTTVQRWWASENPFSPRDYVFSRDLEQCKWIDKTWKLDDFGKTSEGWESSPSLEAFSSNRTFNAFHRYRRRRWIRSRRGMPKNALIDGANAFFLFPKNSWQNSPDKKTGLSGIQLAVQVNGGRWSLISSIPRQGSAHGVVRVNRARWPNATGELPAADSAVFELCYVVSPLDGDWGLLTRSIMLTSRFLLQNDSTTTSFEIKQTGASDTTSVILHPGQTEPFYWGNCRLPELVSVRPSVLYQGRCIYRWSGGFDPLVIGYLALRIRRVSGLTDKHRSHELRESHIRSVKAEVEIRPGTGGTGINLSFQEEDESGEGALYRIENFSPFPIWFCQDDVLSNPSRKASDEDHSDIVGPSGSMVFALDIPFKQGKYAHRKAVSFSTLLRVRLALSPFSTRAGIETTKVISMTTGDTVRLNPSKLMILAPEIRNALQDVRVIGALLNDGPTRVLRLRLMAFNLSDIQPWPHPASISWHDDLPSVLQEVVHGAVKAADMRRLKLLQSEEDTLKLLLSSEGEKSVVIESSGTRSSHEMLRNLVVSIRVAFGGLMVSFVDSAPSEIALATFKNINAIATWDSLRVTNSTVYITVTSVQVDNMVPNSPFPVAVAPIDPSLINISDDTTPKDDVPPLLVVGLSFAPKHKSGILCLKSATIAPRNLAIKVDLAFLVRLQKFALDLREHFHKDEKDLGGRMKPPDLYRHVAAFGTATDSGSTRKKIFFGGLTILPCNIKLSVAPARALTPAQAALEGTEIAAIHQAVRKGDVRLDRTSAGILGVKIGSRNKTPLAVVRGLFKSFIVDGLLRLDGASLNFAGVSLRNHTSTSSQLTTALTAHYLASLRQNLPAVLGSLGVFGNPLGLVRGLGEGVGDFVLEPVKGFQRSVQEMDASYLVDGVARGTLSLARHTVGGFADSAAMLAETFSKNMAVLTLDRKYAQKRDREYELRDNDDLNVASGLGSGVQKLVNGFLEGVTGVVRAPIRGAEKHGFEGFAKGIGKGLLGLLVKPIIGISDGFTDIMIGVKGSVEGSSAISQQIRQVRPRRALYGREKAIRSFVFADAAASALMLRTSLAGEPYLSHLDLGDRVILISCKRIVMLGREGEELLILKLKHIDRVEVRGVHSENLNVEWGVVIFLNAPRRNGNEVEVIVCNDKLLAEQLAVQLDHGRKMALNH